MILTKAEKNSIVVAITEWLSNVSCATRQETMNAVLKKYDFSDKAKTDPNSKCNAVRSYIGTAFNEMVSSKKIEKRGDGYALCSEKLVTVDDAQCKNAIIELLSKRAFSKKDLYAALVKYFKADKTKSAADDNKLKQAAGMILNDLLAEKAITFNDTEYSLNNSHRLLEPKTPLSEKEFKKLFLERLCNAGGKNFEVFTANLLEKYYIVTGREVLSCEVVGGSDDGGIDVEMVVADELGFTDTLLIQAKCRKNAQVTEKEVREFFGALNLKGGTRGIFITSSTFHPVADKLLRSLNNCVGISGDGIFELAKRSAYGVHKNKDGFVFDETVFRV